MERATFNREVKYMSADELEEFAEMQVPEGLEG